MNYDSLFYSVIEYEIYEHLWDINAKKEDLAVIKEKLSQLVDSAFEEFEQRKVPNDTAQKENM